MTVVPAYAGEPVRVAAASNFATTIETLVPAFETATGHRLSVSTASTGKLYAQIRNGAPFDVLLAADALRPRLLEDAGLAVQGSRMTYAIGRLVLWSREAGFAGDQCRSLLDEDAEGRIAIANPRTAPYGAAARQALIAMGRWEDLRPRLVFGENVAQTLQFAASGNARAGFVAAAQLQSGNLPATTCVWELPQALYDPVEQQAVLLERASANPAAREFLAWLQGDRARSLVRDGGYRLPALDRQ
jgi:molybdate transport system substrate-binding protein